MTSLIIQMVNNLESLNSSIQHNTMSFSVATTNSPLLKNRLLSPVEKSPAKMDFYVSSARLVHQRRHLRTVQLPKRRLTSSNESQRVHLSSQRAKARLPLCRVHPLDFAAGGRVCYCTR